MSQRFNPRYIFRHHKSDSSVIAMTGVREDDFCRILSMCEASHAAEPVKDGDGVRYRREQIETITALRNGGYTVKNGCITVVYDPYDRNKASQPLSIQRVEGIMTTAFLLWADTVDPKHAIGMRMRALLSPTRYADLLEEDETAPLSKDDQRYYHLQSTLKVRLDAPRMARYSRWNGAQKGSFARVVDMTPAEKAERQKELKDRQGFDVMMKKIFADAAATRAAKAEAA